MKTLTFISKDISGSLVNHQTQRWENDQGGSVNMNDIAFLEPFNRHRNVLNTYEFSPVLANSTYIAPNATVFGFVYIASESYVGFGAVVDGTRSVIRIGKNTKIGDNSTIIGADFVPDDAFPGSTNIANNVNIEHNCNIMTATIDDNVHIGFGTTVMQGCQLQRGCVVAPNSYVPPGRRVPQNTLWAGSPIQFVKNLQPYENRLQKGKTEEFRLSLE